jgi:hypothetical protein
MSAETTNDLSANKLRQVNNSDKKVESTHTSEKVDVVEMNTGAIQKRKSNFKTIKPNSLKNSSEIEGK